MSTAAPPLVCTWDGEAFIPKSGRMADKYFMVGENYPLVVHEERSTNTHNHQFAWLHDAWMNLPENIADLYPTETHLRKRALIDAGFYNESIIDCGSKAGALRVAAHLRNKDDFALVIVRGTIVVERTAKSQSRRAMNKQEFNASKQAVLEIVAGMIGVPPEKLSPSSRDRDPAATPETTPARRVAALKPTRAGNSLVTA